MKVTSIHLGLGSKKYLDHFMESIHSSKMEWSVVVRINSFSKVLGSCLITYNLVGKITVKTFDLELSSELRFIQT